jgi:hypothetical protein
MSLALALFDELCVVGTALATYRDRFVPCSDDWTALTCILLTVDGVIDTLVRSQGLGGDDDG